MGYVIHFPAERYGAVSRNTEQPHPVERLAAWIRKAAGIRASASLGCDVSLELAPNIVPIRPLHGMGKVEVIVHCVRLHCRRKHYPRWVQRSAADAGILRLRHGASVRRAIDSAIARADFAAEHGKDPDAA